MLYLRTTALSVPFFLAVSACATAGGSEADPDANTGFDRPDAAPRPDAGTPIDAGLAVDAGQAAVCTENATLACGQTLTDSLLIADATISGYSCEAEATGEVDMIYRFTPPTTGSVTLTLDIDVDTPLIGDDFDLYVLESTCGASFCATKSDSGGDESLTFTATGGTTYYVVVEAFSFAIISFAAYDLTATCP